MRTPTAARGGAHRCLVVAHGAGSSAGFLQRAFPGSSTGAALLAVEDRTGSVERIVDALARAVDAARRRYRQVILGGVSIGAHAAALACAAAPPGAIDGCVFAMPAWTGPAPMPNPTAAAAAEVSSVGAAGVLRRLRADPALRGDWIVDELDAAWRDRPTLAAELRSAAVGAAPTAAELGRIGQPTLVIALAQDPVHPEHVAEEWTAALPSGSLYLIGRHDPGPDRAVFGRAIGQWLAAGAVPG